MQNVWINDIMTAEVVTLRSSDIATSAARIFEEHSFHHIVVVNERGRLEGILSSTDFERIKMGFTLFRNPERAAYDEAVLRSVRIKDFMTHDVISLQPNDSLETAYKIFAENKFRALPVVDDDIPVGIVTPLDLLDYFFGEEPKANG